MECTDMMSSLKRQNLANALCACIGDESTGWSTFTIDFELTERGRACYGDVLQAVFSFLELLKLAGPSKQIFDEYSMLGIMLANHHVLICFSV